MNILLNNSEVYLFDKSFISNQKHLFLLITAQAGKITE